MPPPVLLALFVAVPLLELYLLIKVSAHIGVLLTIIAAIATAAIGIRLLREQGHETLLRAQAQMQRGHPPAQEMLEGAVLLVGGGLLLTPGFITDAVGLFCLVPFSRRWLVQGIRSRYTEAPQADASGPQTIDGEYEREPHEPRSINADRDELR